MRYLKSIGPLPLEAQAQSQTPAARFGMRMQGARLAALSASCLLVAVAHAEPPMVTDDASTLERGGAKVEFQLSRDGKLRSGDLALGYAPIEHLETQIAFSRGKDRSTSPTSSLNATGLTFKWVPWRLGEQTAFGVRLDYGVERVSPGGGKARGTQVTALATEELPNGIKLHANLGRTWIKPEGGLKVASNYWAVGVDIPLAGPAFSFVADVYGEQHVAAGRQIGLRWRPMEGTSLSAAVGKQDGQSHVLAVGAWEF